jgi:RimJ/RimL family protein N-acetyltransferase
VLAIPAIAPNLQSEAALLVQLDHSVHQRYCELMADPISRHFTGTIETFSDQKLLEWLSSRPGQTNRLDWAILHPLTGELLGEVVLNELDAETESMNFRIAMFEGASGQGIGSQVTRLVVDYGLNELQLRQITLDVWVENPRAIRVYEKAGFVMRSRFVDDGREFFLMAIQNPAR